MARRTGRFRRFSLGGRDGIVLVLSLLLSSLVWLLTNLSNSYAGLVSVPVIAVPTSVGYGASFNGLSALLTMINSCANGIAVVNIDNGYGAGYMATMINRLALKETE